MNHFYIYFLFLSAIQICHAQVPQAGNLQLIWSDEFEIGSKPDTSKWSYERGYVRNQELQWYQPDNVSLEDGKLIIEGRKTNFDNPNFDATSSSWKENRKKVKYTSGSINTKGKFDFKYGVLEVKAKIDTSMGSWPAIWTLGIDQPWPRNGEIDLLEFYRYNDEPTILANFAWATKTKHKPYWNSGKFHLNRFLEKDPEWVNKFHVWKLVWMESKVEIYLDDELLNSQNQDEIINPDGFEPYKQPHFILLNLALGSNGGDPSKSEFPIQYEVDYVRVYDFLND